jgi:ankyrin repeat protein
MLMKFGADVKEVNSSGINCLHIAAQGDKPKVLHFLLINKFFDIEETDINGCTALHWACYSGSY